MHDLYDMLKCNKDYNSIKLGRNIFSKIFILYGKYYHIKGNCDKLNTYDNPPQITEISESIRYMYKQEKKNKH